MHIVVLLKQVFDPSTPPSSIEIGPDKMSIKVTSGLPSVMNGYDANAVEEAIRIKERHGATVTAITLGDEAASAGVRRAIAMGADNGVLVVAPSGIDQDSSMVATLLSAAIKRLSKVDLVLCGRSASDTDAGQVPAIVAASLSAPIVSPVRAVQEVAAEAIMVERISDHGAQRVKVKFPCVLGVSNEMNKPRTPGLKGVMTSKKAQLTIFGPADLAAGERSTVRLKCVAAQETKKVHTEIIGGSPEVAGAGLADRLVQEGLIA